MRTSCAYKRITKMIHKYYNDDDDEDVTKPFLIETHIKNLYNVLSEEQTINLIYGEKVIPFYIMSCKPNKHVSMDEIEELEVDIEPINEPKPAELIEEPVKQEEPLNEEFIPFSGKGHSLK